ncbi:MAG: Ca-activated chloride channel [Solirubrobacteraceae bacterium]|nr:Ca-activated chloride channel [Solirubrobacteraceae bacterium]
MSFQAPLFLLGLPLVALLAVAYAARQAGGAARAAAWASPRMLPSVAPRRPGWRRHVPMAIFALALAVLVVALARPQASVAVDVERASVVLVTDRSGSMAATDVAPTRLRAALGAADAFLRRVPKQVRVGAVAFNQDAATLQRPTTNRQAVRQKLAALVPSGGTATGDALAAALRAIRLEPTVGGKRPPSAIVLISDGKSVRGRSPLDAAREARRLKVPIYTVALGTPQGTITVRTANGTQQRRVPPDPTTLQQVANLSGGQAFGAADATKLDAVYRRLGSQVSTEHQQREVTSAFAGGAIVLLLMGSGLSLHWFRRPV